MVRWNIVCPFCGKKAAMASGAEGQDLLHQKRFFLFDELKWTLAKKDGDRYPSYRCEECAAAGKGIEWDYKIKRLYTKPHLYPLDTMPCWATVDDERTWAAEGMAWLGCNEIRDSLIKAITEGRRWIPPQPR